MKNVLLKSNTLMINYILSICVLSLFMKNAFANEITQQNKDVYKRPLASDLKASVMPDSKTDSEKNRIIDCYRCCVGAYPSKRAELICKKFHNQGCKCENDIEG